MRALSIRQSWVEQILRAEKLEEYRSWKTTHQGDLLLHASKTLTEEELEGIREMRLQSEDLPLGALVGVVSVDGYDGDKGDYAWLLSNPRRFQTPIPYKGAAGIFLVPDELVAEALSTAVPTPKFKRSLLQRLFRRG